MKYLVITTAFNEENHIDFTLKSVVKQSILPTEWIIVNDGSTDKTKSIIEKYTVKYPWIKILNQENKKVEFGTHAVLNFYIGFKVRTKNDYDFIVKLDADLDIDRSDFFEYQFKQFKKFPSLGISSGITYYINNGRKVLNMNRAYWRTGGAMKVYRRICFEQIKGLEPIYGWDGLDEYRAMYNGWKTRTFFCLHVNHLGKQRSNERENQVYLAQKKGKSLYQRGYPIEFIILKIFQYVYSKGLKWGFSFAFGYFRAFKKKEKIFVTKDEIFFIRKLQYLRLIDKITSKQLL